MKPAWPIKVKITSLRVKKNMNKGKNETKKKFPPNSRERLLLLFHIQVPKCTQSFSKSKVEIVTKIGNLLHKIYENSIFTLWNWKKNQSELE